MDAVAVQVQQAPQPQPKAPQQQTQKPAAREQTQQKGEARTLRDIMAANAAVEGEPQQVVAQGSFLAMMLQQMIGVEGMPAEGVLLPDEGFAVLKAQLEKDGSEVGAQMLMEMLMGAGQSVSIADISELVAQMTGEVLPETGVVTAGLNATDMIALLTGKQPVVQPQATEQQAAAPQTAVVQEVAGAAKNAEQGAGQESSLSGQAAFQQAILEAQKLLKAEKGTAKEATPIDVDQLQSKVDASKVGLPVTNQIPPYAGAETVKEAVELKLPTPEELMAQIKTGVAAGMNTGKDEFVIKLKPDGLGEITVKMVETGGHISMSIVTSNTQVQRMISSELAGLREAMKPFGVEVAQVTSQNPGHFNADQQNNFGGHQHQQFHENHATSTWFEGGENGETNPEERNDQQPESGSLNTYI